MPDRGIERHHHGTRGLVHLGLRIWRGGRANELVVLRPDGSNDAISLCVPPCDDRSAIAEMARKGVWIFSFLEPRRIQERPPPLRHVRRSAVVGKAHVEESDQEPVTWTDQRESVTRFICHFFSFGTIAGRNIHVPDH